MLNSDLRDDGVPATSKVRRNLQRSRAGYQGFLTKLFKEMEFLLLDKQNVELVNSKLKVVHGAFIKYERAHTSIWKASIIRRRFREQPRHMKAA